MASTPVIEMGTRSSFNDRTVVRPNIDEQLDYLTPTDLPFLNYIGFASDAAGAWKGANSLKFPCIQQQHTWLDDDLVPTTSSVYSTFTLADAYVVVPDGESERFSVGDLYSIGDSTYIVTATDHSTNRVTGTALSDDATHAANTAIRIMGNAHIEGELASAVEAKTTDFGQTTNYTQILMDKVSLTGTERSTERYGITGDPYDRELAKCLTRMGIQLEQLALYGRRNSSYPSTNTTARRMGGLAHFIRDATGANVTDAAGADFDEIVLNDMLQSIWSDGGAPDTLMVGPRQKRVISSFLVPAVRVDRTENMAGVVVGGYESDFGTINVVLNRWLRASDALFLTSGMIGIGPLDGNGNSRAFFTEDLPRLGDKDETLVTGEYTMEVRNPLKAHGWVENLSES